MTPKSKDPCASSATLVRLGPRLTPRGRLLLEVDDEAPVLSEDVAARLTEAFARGSGPGLLHLGGREAGNALPPALAWWRDFAARYVVGLCGRGAETPGEAASTSAPPVVPPPSPTELATLLLTRPMSPGSEYLSMDMLLSLWDELGAACAAELPAAAGDLQAFLRQMNPVWNLVGRVHFNLAENRRDPDHPFAFMATYTSQLSGQGRAQHTPLARAIRDNAGPAGRETLLSLLKPVQRAAERLPWLRAMVEAGEIFHPLRWTAVDAGRFLASVPDLEQAGVVARMPAAWKAGRPPRPRVTATVGTRPPSALGLDGLLDFNVEMTIEGEPLTAAELNDLLAGTGTLALLRGQWVEIDRERLGKAMHRFNAAQALAERNGLTFAEAMRLLAGASMTEEEADPEAADWAGVSAGPWLSNTLEALRAPGGGGVNPGPELKGTLRPYQEAGVRWLHLLSGLGLGACLADDMGLGKTIQVLALLLSRRRQGVTSGPSLLVAPASLLANWADEIARFAPTLTFAIIHPSAMTAEAFKAVTPETFAPLDLVITTYGSLLRTPRFAETRWRIVILDEAQAIKNPAAKQTRAVKALKADARIALTGTPVENQLGDLWSIFDFINPGLLGGASRFKTYAKGLADRPHNPYGPLRALVAPYILRRMKTDKAVIADLPDKIEVNARCALSRKQAALYAQTVSDLEEALEAADGIARKGIVLTTLMRLKQICNHPSHWLGDDDWAEADSGKLAALREIAEVVAQRQEKMLIFTQFREMTDPLAAFLGGIFGRPGLVLHGATAVRDRKGLVARFQEDDGAPFFVLSLKAGGSGLNLTAASHVVHFDRWWNPAVENQATDRAFRIGQKRSVLVHKFVCQGTIEEKIDAMIGSKRALADELLAGSAEIRLTEMPNDELLRLVALDLGAVMKD